MAAPAITAAVNAVVAKVEAITPTIDTAQLFRRGSEKAPTTTRAGKRLFDVEAAGLRDESNDGRGVQVPGVADRIATVVFVVTYPVARSERALETTLLEDMELLLRAVTRSASWAGTPVRRVAARAAVNRTFAEPVEQQPGELQILLTAEIHYRDTE